MKQNVVTKYVSVLSFRAAAQRQTAEKARPPVDTVLGFQVGHPCSSIQSKLHQLLGLQVVLLLPQERQEVPSWSQTTTTSKQQQQDLNQIEEDTFIKRFFKS